MATQSQKPENIALIQSNFTERITVSKLRNLCVVETTSERRKRLWENFSALYVRMLGAGLAGLDVWVDGSFVTQKNSPTDIDCVLWLPQSHIDNCTDEQYQELVRLRDRRAIWSKYLVDLYIVPPEDSHNMIYWTALFSLTKDASASKGFARLTL